MARLRRDLKREQTWRRHLEQQRSSGVTARAYCRANALHESAFFFWKKEIAKRDSESTSRTTDASPAVPAAPAFVPVAVIDPPATASGEDERETRRVRCVARGPSAARAAKEPDRPSDRLRTTTVVGASALHRARLLKHRQHRLRTRSSCYGSRTQELAFCGK